MTSKECTECRMYGNLIACTNTLCSKKYEPLPWYIAEHTAELEAENAKLKAREANYLEGLYKLENLMITGDVEYDTTFHKWTAYDSGNKVATGEDLSILIDNLLTQEQKDVQKSGS